MNLFNSEGKELVSVSQFKHEFDSHSVFWVTIQKEEKTMSVSKEMRWESAYVYIEHFSDIIFIQLSQIKSIPKITRTFDRI